jgi:hypothetical protein
MTFNGHGVKAPSPRGVKFHDGMIHRRRKQRHLFQVALSVLLWPGTGFAFVVAFLPRLFFTSSYSVSEIS